MPEIKPFRAFRPVKDKVHLVVTRSYLTYSKKILEFKLASNPYTFLHVVNPDFGIKDKELLKKTSKHQLAKQKFEHLCQEKVLIQDEKPALYIYNQVIDEHSFIGVIGATAIQDYHTHKIKIHENTLTKREEIFKQYLQVTEINAEPVLLTYEHCDTTEKLIEDIIKKEPLYDFSTSDTARHQVWQVFDEKVIEKISKSLADVDAFYIADGHHRTASSARLADENKQKKNEAYNYFMSFLVSDKYLKIHSFNRLIKDLTNFSYENILAKLEKDFEIKILTKSVSEINENEIGMYVAKKWHLLTLKSKKIDVKNVINSLESKILDDYILKPILGIADAKKSNKIAYVSGKTPLQELAKIVDSKKSQIAFALPVVSTQKLFEIANQNGIMPPKSTYIEPKLRSALTIYSLK